jgi:hypothetical protein
MTTYSDYGYGIRRQRASQTISKERLNIIHHSLEVELEAGVGLITDTPAILDWSNDGGHTWSNQHFASIGMTGNYTARAIWRQLGVAKNRVYRITIDDPVKVVILDADAQLEECKA